jgi:hypothetical protein
MYAPAPSIENWLAQLQKKCPGITVMKDVDDEELLHVMTSSKPDSAIISESVPSGAKVQIHLLLQCADGSVIPFSSHRTALADWYGLG